MGHRLSKITTRTGDQGTTGLANGVRVEKDSPRILAIGAVDELNSWVGFVLAHDVPEEVRTCLLEVQQHLFEVGAELSLPERPRVSDANISRLEAAVESFNQRLEPLREFVLPGGSLVSAACHVARTVCRRAECQVVTLRSVDPVKEDRLIPYLNRLSDLLFVIARLLNNSAAMPETLWKDRRP